MTRAISVLKWTSAALLGAVLLGGVALVCAGPADAYAVTCRKAPQIVCLLEQDLARNPRRTEVRLETPAEAVVQVKHLRRGSDRVLLYLQDPSQARFAAEFEGDSAVTEARAAAARLNGVFAAEHTATARIEARPPQYLQWATRAGVALLALLVGLAWRELFS